MTENTGKGHDKSEGNVCQLIVDTKLPLATADKMTATVKIISIASSKAHFFFILC